MAKVLGDVDKHLFYYFDEPNLTNHEQARTLSQDPAGKISDGRMKVGIIISAITFVITILLSIFTGHTIRLQKRFEHRWQQFKKEARKADREKIHQYRAIGEQIRFTTDLLSVNYRHSLEKHPLNPLPTENNFEHDSDHGISE